MLATVAATDDPATAWYAGSIAKAGAATGIEVRESRLASHDGDGVLSTLDSLAADPEVHAIICLTPLPGSLTLAEAGERIPPGEGRRRREPAQPRTARRRRSPPSRPRPRRR